MKKIIIRLVVSILVLIIPISLVGCSKNFDKVTTYYLDANEEFKILTLADLHFVNTSNIYDIDMLDRLDRMVTYAQADLIIICGDIVYASSDNINVLPEIVEKLDSYKTPWAFVYGNHDPESTGSLENKSVAESNKLAMNQVFADSEYCIFEAGPEDVDGQGNYIVNIKNAEEKIIQTLFFLDSGDYTRMADAEKYDYIEDIYTFPLFNYGSIYPSQIQWYENTVLELAEYENGGDIIPSLAFFHIPLPEYETCWDLYEEGSDEIIYIEGSQGESVCCPKYNTGMFAKMVELGSTKATFVGHDHANDYNIDYQGIQLNYIGGMRTLPLYTAGSSIVSSKFGGRIITIKADGSFTNDRVLDRDVLEQLEQE